jgi:MFS transporter, FHS family, L-fucose permease
MSGNQPPHIAEKRALATMAMVTANSGQATAGTGESGKYQAALAMVTVLFFFWGFVTVLNDILVPHLKSVFDLNYARVMLIQFAFFLAYFIFSIPSAKLVGAIGYKKTMVTGLLTMGLGAFLFVPAASALSYPLFLCALMVLAAGITALQVAANPYVAVLGPPETASSRLNLTQAFNSLGTTIGPWIGGLLILGTAVESSDAIAKMSADALHAFRLQQAASVKFPYIVIGLALILFAVLIGMFKLPAIPGVEKSTGGASQVGLWKYRHLILGCVAIFMYVGAEVSIGSFLINYFNQPEIGNLPEVEGAKLVAGYWGGAMIGRFIGSAVLNGIKRKYLAILSAFAAIAGLASYMSTLGSVESTASLWVRFFAGLTYILVQFRPIVVLCLIVFVLLLLGSFTQSGLFRLKTGPLLGLCAISTTSLVLISMLSTGHVAMWSIIFVGFFNSIMFPSIFTLGIAKLGPRTGDGSGLLIMAIVGGAIIPLIQGVIADRIGIHHAFVLPVLCYLYIAYYALKGSQPVGVE